MAQAKFFASWTSVVMLAGAALLGGCEDKNSPPASTTPAPAPTAAAEKVPSNTPAAPAGASKPETAAAAAAAPASNGDVILIGHYGSMTGKEATFGQSTDRGIRLAVKDFNAAGGLNGKMVELKTYDTKGESKEAGTAVTRLITDDHVVAVLGEVASSLSLAGGAVCQEKQVPMISPSSTNPQVTRGRDFVFRVCFTDDQQAAAIARFVHENLKFTKAAILYDQTQTYSKGLRDDFTKTFKAMGGTIVSDQAYSGGDQDFSAQLTTIKGAGPEILFVPGYYTEGGNVSIQARKLGLKVPLIGGDGWDSEQLGAIGKEAIEGSYYSNHSAPDQPSSGMPAFITKYKAEYGGETPDALTGLGYDAATVLFDSMKRAKSLGGKDLRDAIAATSGLKGVTGTITIDENRNAKKPIVIVQMKKGADGKLGPHFVAEVEGIVKK